MRVLPLLIIAVIVLFFAGLIAPQRSKRLQAWVDGKLQQGKVKGDRGYGWVGDWTARSLHWGQKVNAAAVRAGRRVRGGLSGAGHWLREKLSSVF
jgi:hypothetical protein